MLNKIITFTAVFTILLFAGFIGTQRAFAAGADDFVTTWDTTNPGTSAANQITIPANGTYDVDWDGDNIFDEFGLSGTQTHTYGVSGIYTVRVLFTSGTGSLGFLDGGDKDKILSIEQWGTTPWASGSGAFQGCSNLVDNAVDIPDLSVALNLNFFFQDTTAYTGAATIGTWNVSNVTDMASFFNGSAFNQDISNWDVSSVQNMNSMFRDTPFNQDISNWNTSSVTSMNSTFRGTPFNQDINTKTSPSRWDVSNVNDMTNMFRGATSFNQDISNWNTSMVTTMNSMFNGAIAFNQDIGNWDMTSLTNVVQMFANATSFNQDISSKGGEIWDMSGVSDLSGMFTSATSFNQDISNWDTSNVTIMFGTFGLTTAFDQNLGAWNVTSLSNATQMFAGVTLNTPNYDALLVGWEAQVLNGGVTFDGGSSLYCAVTEHGNIDNAPNNWNVTDGGLDPACTPANPVVAPDLQVASDLGTSNGDNITSDNTPSFDVGCSAIGNTITLYTDNPIANTSAGTYICTSIGTETATTTILADGVHNITYTDTNAVESGNSPALAVTIDNTAPGIPVAALDLQSASDTGSSITDDISSDATPTFDVVCTETSSIITLYVGGVARGTHNCTVAGTEAATIAPALADGTFSITYSETDVAGNESGQSSLLSITIDTAIAASTLNAPTNGSPVTGTAEIGSTAVVTTTSGSTCTTITDGSGNYSCTLAPGPIDGEDVTVVATDIAGNTDAPGTTQVGGIDVDAPTSPTVNIMTAGSTTITGTGENGTTITIAGITCTNAPVVVAGGIWSCDVQTGQEPQSGDTVTATSTDGAGNTSNGSYVIPIPSSGGGGSSSYSKAELDLIFGRNTSSNNNQDPSNALGEGELCPNSQIIHQNLKAPAHNGSYHPYTKATVTEVKLLQAHMNRLGFNSGFEDGILGPLTEGAIKRMQVFLGTIPDGYVGPITRGLINNSCGETKEVQETNAQCYIDYTRLIVLGRVGEDVKQVQACMNSLGYTSGPEDGIYGPLTYAGITAYQQAQRLQFIDGVVGLETSISLNTLVNS